VHTFQSFHVDTGMHGVYVASAPDTAKKAADSVREELAKLASEGLPDDELEAGKRQLKGQITLALESPISRMSRLVSDELTEGRYRPLDEVLGLVEAVTLDDAAGLAAEFFPSKRQTVLRLGPAA
jgi:predicted Zn-dependent peptidase